MTGYEYRLRYRRLGRGPTSRILQTERGALAKADGLVELDEMKGGTGFETFLGMPDLELLVLERREVGAWEIVKTYDLPEPDPLSADIPQDVAPDDDGIPF